jgi:hypothetical protein
MDHLPDPIRRRLHQPGDRRHIVPAGRRKHHHRSTPLHNRPVGLPTTPDNLLELPAFLVTHATDTHTFSHPPSLRDSQPQMVDAAHQPPWSEH